MDKQTYKEKFLDPRWQKKRLEILERDQWFCQMCGENKRTLHIHHKNYIKDRDPWDYPDNYLVTLCEECHQYETDNLPNIMWDHNLIIRSRFSSAEIHEITMGIYKLSTPYPSEVESKIIKMALTEPKIVEYLIKQYFKHIKTEIKNGKKKNG